jgi:hypothetical protein
VTRSRIPVVLLAVASICGCSSTNHILFSEEDHLGLRVAFAQNSPSPAELSIAYRRGVVAVVPQQSSSTQTGNFAVRVKKNEDGKGGTVTVVHDPNELMALYTRFQANVGLGDPICVNHFLATGNAANALVANNDALRDVTKNFSDMSNPCQKK